MKKLAQKLASLGYYVTDKNEIAQMTFENKNMSVEAWQTTFSPTRAMSPATLNWSGKTSSIGAAAKGHGRAQKRNYARRTA